MGTCICGKPTSTTNKKGKKLSPSVAGQIKTCGNYWCGRVKKVESPEPHDEYRVLYDKFLYRYT